MQYILQFFLHNSSEIFFIWQRNKNNNRKIYVMSHLVLVHYAFYGGRYSEFIVQKFYYPHPNLMACTSSIDRKTMIVLYDN